MKATLLLTLAFCNAVLLPLQIASLSSPPPDSANPRSPLSNLLRQLNPPAKCGCALHKPQSPTTIGEINFPATSPPPCPTGCTMENGVVYACVEAGPSSGTLWQHTEHLFYCPGQTWYQCYGRWTNLNTQCKP